jgi:hypothetical protein
MDEATRAGLPLRLKVADANDPSLQLYLRLGFHQIANVPAYLEMEWRQPQTAAEPGESAGAIHTSRAAPP